MSDTTWELVKIESARLGFEGHGILSIHLALTGEGWGCGYGGFAYRSGKDADERYQGYDGALGSTIHTLLTIFEAEQWSDLIGKLVWAETEGWGGKIRSIRPVAFTGPKGPTFKFEDAFEKQADV
jgi:hypothetical protein